MSRLRHRLPTAAAVFVLAAAVLWQFLPILRCGGDCVADLPALHGKILGGFETADVRLNVWILGWVQHALALQPFSLFDANAFYPAPAALAGSEHMLGLALLTWPLRLFTSDAISIYSWTLALTSFVLALNTYALARWLTGSSALALMVAVTTPFMPWRIAELAHLQLLGAHWFPLIWLLALRVLLNQGGLGLRLALAVVVTLQLLTSYYLAYMLTFSLLLLCVGAVLVRSCNVRAVMRLAAACSVSYGILLAFSIPYLARSARGEIDTTYGMGMVTAQSDIARFVELVLPRAELFWSRLAQGQTAYYVPLIVALLALGTLLRTHAGAGAAVPVVTRQRAALVGLWLNVPVALVFMLGSTLRVDDVDIRLPGYWLGTLIPGFAHFRAQQRWAILIGLAAPVLAAVGLQRIAHRLRSRGAQPPIAAAGIALAAAGLFVNVPWLQVPGTSIWADGFRSKEAYERLAQLPDGPVVEIPWYEQPLPRTLIDSNYLVAATIHWKPILNGMTGYPPPSMTLLNSVAQRLPDASARRLLARMTGLRWIVVHVSAGESVAAHWRSMADGLRPVYADDSAWIFEVPQAERTADWLEPVRTTAQRDLTISGHPRTPLRLPVNAGEFQAALTGKATLQFPAPYHVTIQNRGNVVWPGFDYQSEGVVQVRYIFDRSDGTRAAAGLVPLFADIEPGGTLDRTILIRSPQAPGHYRLCMDLVQPFGGAFHELAIAPVALEIDVVDASRQNSAGDTLAAKIADAVVPPDWPSRCSWGDRALSAR